MPIMAANEILKSFDARDWARAFVCYVHNNPAIPTDEETMTGWFANALMRGYDELSRQLPVGSVWNGRYFEGPGPDFSDENNPHRALGYLSRLLPDTYEHGVPYMQLARDIVAHVSTTTSRFFEGPTGLL